MIMNKLKGLNDKTDNIFGERLKYLRENVMNLTQKDFSTFLDIPQPTLSSYETGRNKPTIDVVVNICQKCNISIDWLCGFDKGIINNLGDLTAFLFNLYSSNEFSVKTDFHEDDDNTKKQVILILTYDNINDLSNETLSTYNSAINEIVKNVDDLNNELCSYRCKQDYYNYEKKQLIDKYISYPVTHFDISDMTESERKSLAFNKIRNEMYLEEHK